MDENIRWIKKSIPKELWRQARAQAILQGKTITEWIAVAISEKLKRDEGKK